MPMKLHYGRFSIEECKENPDDLYVFGDNFKRYGKGGQAIIRDCPNTVGFASKRAPGRNNADFLDDTCQDLIRDEFKRFHAIIETQLKQGKTVWWPADGVGTGLAKMPERAPKLYQRMCEYSRSLFKITGKQTVSVIVCGSRDFKNRNLAYAELDALFDETMNNDNIIFEIIEGDCKGADKIAGKWADDRESRGVIHTKVPADWTGLGYAAGPIRNAEMAVRLRARRDQAGTRARVLGMPGNKGTNNMLKIAAKHGFEIDRICMGPDYTPPRPGPGHANSGHAGPKHVQSQSEHAQVQVQAQAQMDM